ncbi:DEAD-box type RNA helicase [Purpureocillium takamizusanense]|uniref:DEAD-box type RNA helicase n=1 Tax=Purpureocillium takamizusanense TaxID=2060973 RepID=A0A9Q8VGX6_9HYPO|nr:DEAD-box type RNA helicase [Purpureocillium takamizusanense]UNI24349.1 DEAD-box type RNA helicase [Purpureocillium takamizusanense]
MAEYNEDLAKWFEELQKIPSEHHLLCPKVGPDDDEDYKTLDDPESHITVDEKKRRIEDGERRVEITYWNSLIFGFEKKDAGQWLSEFTARLESCLKECPACVLNWHMKRKAHLQMFAERWNEESMAHIEYLLDKLDVARIEHNIQWAKAFIEKIEASGAVFKKTQFGSHLSEVFITVYEGLCCVTYIGLPEQRSAFQYVFMRLQGKTPLKLGSKDPLPGMTYFLFDMKVEDRLKWAYENWKAVDSASLTEEQFDWAVSGGLIKAIDDISRKDLFQATVEDYLDIERFWSGFECILRTLNDDLILSRLRSLEVRPGNPDIYDLLFRHIQSCRSEGVLVATIRILTSLLRQSPKAFWDAVGDAKPNVIADLIFSSPVYKALLRQSLESCWGGNDPENPVPFPISWISPWLQSLRRDHRFDACEVLMHTLFKNLAKDESIGEPGHAACVRAGFDALTLTLNSFLESKTRITGTTHLYASSAFNLVLQNKDLVLQSLKAPKGQHEGWTTLKVADAAKTVLHTARKLDMKMLFDEFHAIHEGQAVQTTVPRDSGAFWESHVEIFDMSSNQAVLAKAILSCLEPLVSIEDIRPEKTKKLSGPGLHFNKTLKSVTDVIVRILGRISELDTPGLQTLFEDRHPVQTIVGLSVHDHSDLGEASMEVLKSWTGELSRDSALQHMAQQHAEQTLSSIIWTMERVVRPPFPWDPIRPLLNASHNVLQGLANPSSGLLRQTTLDSRMSAMLLRWWTEQWRFVSKCCLNIEGWSMAIDNKTMTEFCRDIMELAEALIKEDGLLTSATAGSRGQAEAMVSILRPAKDNFRGMENMIRLKDLYLVDTTVRVLRQILTRLRENGLEINAASRKLIMDACIPTSVPGRYLRSTNLNDRQRAELLRALGHDEEDVQIVQIGVATRAPNRTPEIGHERSKKQSKLDAWSKSAAAAGASSSTVQPGRTNRSDVLELSKSLESPVLKQIAARQSKTADKPKTLDAKAISALKESRQREKAEKARRDAEAIAKARRLRGETVPGEGSGIHGLSLTGKDHSRSEIMVNSSDEESSAESDDSDADTQLAALSTGGEKNLDEHEKRKLQALRDKIRRPVKKIRQQRSVKEMRARLIPPMDRLHNTILAWDIFHEGGEPPSGPKASEVATKYANPMSYQETFFPLLASEAWRAFVTAKDEITTPPFEMKTAGRASVDSFLEVSFTMPIAQNRERVVSEGDIILVSEDRSPIRNPAAKHCLARVHRLTYKKDVVEVLYRVASHANPLSKDLVKENVVYGIKITNMTTIEREYAALESLQYYDLMDEILKAEPSPILRYGDERISNAMGNWALNRGQALAVLGAHENDGFTLIQGPPGTGKTKTIVAMVGSLLSEQLSHPNAGVPIGNPMRPANGVNTSRSKKLLVCAPSNAAVDELVLRLKAGVTTMNGKTRHINVLRLGKSERINAAVKDVTLDELVRVRLEGDTTKEKAKADREKLHADAARIKEELGQLRPRLEEAREQEDRAVANSLSRKFDELKSQQIQIGKLIDADKNSGNSIAREMDVRRRQVQQEILNSAHVLCATLSGSGHEMFRNLEVEFETVIIDEAAQCVELSALIPLKYGCCKCILVGDPKQLPPTVLSQSAARFGYDQSLFVRMQQNHPNSIHLLDMQYRMHPEISMFPSREFYEGQLRDGQDMFQLRQKPWHGSELLGPYRFFDVEGVQEKGHRGQSLVNIKELEVAMQLYDAFSKKYAECDLRGKIGIITPYKAQLFELQRRFQKRFGDNILEAIEFNTTDAFQGRECEIIIFSCVRASSTGGIGFMTDIRRMNVGLTRAKSSLWILGDSRALVQGEFWRKLIEDARSRDRYTRGDVLSTLRRPLEQAKPGSFVPVAPVAVSREIEMTGVVLNDPKPTAGVIPGERQLAGSGGANAMHEPGTANVRSGSGLPVIHSSDSTTKKRPIDNTAPGGPGPKRAANDKPRSGFMAKFGQKPSRPSTAPKDPSAMSVLGMTPPERPPAPLLASSTAYPMKESSSSSLPTVPATGDKPPPKPIAAPVRKKPKPSLFMPKKR